MKLTKTQTEARKKFKKALRLLEQNLHRDINVALKECVKEIKCTKTVRTGSIHLGANKILTS